MLATQELDVVSTTYKGRYAVRWDLVPNDLRPDYFQLIRTYTGINPDNQLTAGAGLTEKAPGHPGVCFPNQMVVGIDDHDFTTRLGGRARLSAPGRIYRSVPGRRLDARSYAGRLARMVAVRALREGATLAESATQVEEFLGKEKYLVVPKPVSFSGAVTTADLEEIVAGLANFEKLTSKWQEVVDVIGELEAGLPTGSSCRFATAAAK